MRFLSSILIALAMATPLAQATSAPAVAAGDAPKTVLLVGDSLSAAHRIPPETGWAVLLQHRLDAALPQPPAVVNVSRDGMTLTDALEELPALLAAHHPQLVIFELGANDVILGARSLELKQNMSRLIDMARTAGAQVAVLGFAIPARLDKYHRANRARRFYFWVRQNKHVVVLPSLMAGISGQRALLLDDGVHPTAAAQARMLDNAWTTLNPLLLD